MATHLDGVDLLGALQLPEHDFPEGALPQHFYKIKVLQPYFSTGGDFYGNGFFILKKY